MKANPQEPAKSKEDLFCRRLQSLLLKQRVAASDVPLLLTLATQTISNTDNFVRICSATPRNRTRPGPLLWPVDRLPELLGAMCLPSEAGTRTLVEFFKDVATLEFMAAGKRSPVWASHTLASTTAAVVALSRRTSIQRKLRGFNGRDQLYNTEILLGLTIYELSRAVRNEIGKVLSEKAVARVCDYCHRLADCDRRKFCSDECMYAARDARKASKRRQAT